MALPTSYSGTDIAQLTGQAIRAFAAASQGSDVVFNAVLGMRTTVYLVEYDYAAGIAADVADDLRATAERAIPAVVRAAGNNIVEEQIYLGMGALAALIRQCGKSCAEVAAETAPNLIQDRMDHVSLLAAELEVVARRRSIEMRGDVLRRVIVFSRFHDRQYPIGFSLH